MPLTQAEAIVLRDYSLAEADLIATLFTLEFGKIRAVAKAARRLKNRFSGNLEPLSHIRIEFYERENRDLVYLNRCDLEETFFDLQADYGFQVACAYMVEIIDALVPDREASPRVFRLLLSILRARKEAAESIPLLAYFNFWMLRLSGLLPVLDTCVHCGTPLGNGGGRLILAEHKVYCQNCKRSGGASLTADCIIMAQTFARESIRQVLERGTFTLSVFERFNAILERLVVAAVDKPIKCIDLLHELRRSPGNLPGSAAKHIPAHS
ncbi:MAG: DNA repair protein RecO [Acidobacteriia bacterium]|nr:DNA repair protein RecO [Terriglobia bacterium]